MDDTEFFGNKCTYKQRREYKRQTNNRPCQAWLYKQQNWWVIQNFSVTNVLTNKGEKTKSKQTNRKRNKHTKKRQQRRKLTHRQPVSSKGWGTKPTNKSKKQNKKRNRQSGSWKEEDWLTDGLCLAWLYRQQNWWTMWALSVLGAEGHRLNRYNCIVCFVVRNVMLLSWARQHSTATEKTVVIPAVSTGGFDNEQLFYWFKVCHWLCYRNHNW